MADQTDQGDRLEGRLNISLMEALEHIRTTSGPRTIKTYWGEVQLQSAWKQDDFVEYNARIKIEVPELFE